jgi:hydrogenase nickel incorporation protein HypA/HybF
MEKENAEAIHFVPEIAYVYIRCPNCKSPDFEIMQGRGVWLERIRGMK